MLFRVILATKASQKRMRLIRMLRREDSLVTAPLEKDLKWESLLRETADLIVIHRSLIPKPLPDSIRVLTEGLGNTAIVVIADDEDPSERAEILAAGGEAVLSSHLPAEDIMDVLRTVLRRKEETALAAEIEAPRRRKPELSDFSSKSPSMQAFLGVVQRVVSKDSSLLILGETGTGKEWLARSIHAASPRSEHPFIAINCGALPESLLESELFGHEEGSFTGATHARRGMFELAHRGTIFLDEIGDTPHSLQVKLLRVLQEKEFQRLGSERMIGVDVRIMAATNCDLEAEIMAKRFRRDLYYRLSVIELHVPPLRERVEDIPEIAASYVEYYSSHIAGTVERIADIAVEALTQYSWPGNVRELINVIERAVILCEGEEIHLSHLPDSICAHRASFPNTEESLSVVPSHIPLSSGWQHLSLAQARSVLVESFERTYLSALLLETKGRIGKTATRAGITSRSLYNKMQRHGLRKEDFKPKP